MIKNLTTTLLKLGAASGLAAAFTFSGAVNAAGEANGKVLYNQSVQGLSCGTAGACHGPDPSVNTRKIKNGANNATLIQSAINGNTGGMGFLKNAFTLAQLTDIAAYIANPAAATSAPAISLSATTLSFTNVTVATTSAAQSATLTNSGSAALNFSSLTVTGTNAGEYTRGGTCAVGTPIPAGGTCTLTATFTPTAVGTRTAAISIASDAAATSIALNGTAIAAPPPPAPVATLSPATVSFGSQQINTTSAAQAVTLSNTGNATMTGIAVTLPAGAFAIASNACGATLAAGANCAIGLTFKPTTAIASTATLSVASNGSATPKTAALSGTGTAVAAPTATLTPATYNGGSVLVGASGTAATSTFTNQGPGVISITGVNTTGTDATSFVVGGTCAAGSSVAAGSACTVTTQFTPTGTAGAKSASVAIASNASGSYALALTGTATVPAVPGISVSPATGISFATTMVGSVATAPLTITNSGTGTLNVSAITSSNTTFNVAVSSAAKACAAGMAFALAPADTCEVAVEFKPSTAGQSNGAITVTSNVATPPQVPVSGVAEVAPPPPPPSGGTGGGTATAGTTNVGGGGCTIRTTNTPFDPLLILMAGISLALIVRRQIKR
jgi:trimeric autotransporter adhesin